MPAHTPGPWLLNPTDDGDDIDIDGDGFRVCSLSIQAARECDPPYPEAEVHANARLIAAAPEMLDLLRSVASTWSPTAAIGHEVKADIRALLARLDGAR